MTRRKRVAYHPEHDLYRVLDIDAQASIAQIQRAYWQRAKTVHPDLNPHNQAWAHEQFQQLNEAYDILCDAELRDQYDRARLDALGLWQTAPRPEFPHPPPSTWQPLSGHRFWRAVLAGLLVKGPYRSTFMFGVLACLINFVALIMSLNMQQTNNAVNAAMKPPISIPNLPNTCSQYASIATPVVWSSIGDGGETFQIWGTATHPSFKAYVVHVMSADRTQYLYSVLKTTPIIGGQLMEVSSLRGLTANNYLVELQVQLTDGSWLPKCDVLVRHVPSNSPTPTHMIPEF